MLSDELSPEKLLESMCSYKKPHPLENHILLQIKVPSDWSTDGYTGYQSMPMRFLLKVIDQISGLVIGMAEKIGTQTDEIII